MAGQAGASVMMRSVQSSGFSYHTADGGIVVRQEQNTKACIANRNIGLGGRVRTRENSQSRRKSEPASFLKNLRQIFYTEDTTIINWESDGKITINDPLRLSEEVLGKYFRHNQFSSFQRQLNYFGYYKISGKGKLERCVYTNDALPTGSGGEPGVSAPPYPIDALLSLKRKSVNPSGTNEKNKASTSHEEHKREKAEKRSAVSMEHSVDPCTKIEDTDRPSPPHSSTQKIFLSNDMNQHLTSTGPQRQSGLISSLLGANANTMPTTNISHPIVRATNAPGRLSQDLPVHPVRKLSEATLEPEDMNNDATLLKRARSEPSDHIICQDDVEDFDEKDIFDWAVPLSPHEDYDRTEDASTSEYAALFCDNNDTNNFNLFHSQPRRIHSNDHSEENNDWTTLDTNDQSFSQNSGSTRDAFIPTLSRSLPTNPSAVHMLPPPPHMNDWNQPPNPSATSRLRSDLQSSSRSGDFSEIQLNSFGSRVSNTVSRHAEGNNTAGIPFRASEAPTPTNTLFGQARSLGDYGTNFHFSESFQPQQRNNQNLSFSYNETSVQRSPL